MVEPICLATALVKNALNFARGFKKKVKFPWKKFHIPLINMNCEWLYEKLAYTFLSFAQAKNSIKFPDNQVEILFSTRNKWNSY